MAGVIVPIIAPILAPILAPITLPLAGLATVVGLATGVGLAAGPLSRAFRRPATGNPTISAIHAHQQGKRGQGDAMQAAKGASDLVERAQHEPEQEREQAHQRQEESDGAAEVERMRGEVEQMRARMEELTNAAKHAQDLAEEAQRIADEQRREAEAAKALADQVSRTAAEEIRKAIEAKEAAERRLKEGIQPVVMPSLVELTAAKQRIQYQEDLFHFAIAGISGSGKSSLVNAFRGLRSDDAGAAAVGVTETTLEMTRYHDAHPDSENPFVWYDIPGAGTIKCRDWQYFNDQGLYVFDCIIVLFDNRFTMTDIAILINARRFNIPTYIVRSKADQHIRNIMKNAGYDSDEGDVARKDKLYKEARERFISETRRSVRTNLEDANLPDQRVYIISSSTMLQVTRNTVPKKAIDEVTLINDLFTQAYSRRAIWLDDIQGGSALWSKQ